MPLLIMESPGPDRPNANFQSQLNSRLLAARTIVVNEPLTTTAAGSITQQLTLLAAESDEPIHIMMSHAPGGDTEAGLSVYDLIRSLDAPVTILGSGRIAGAGLLAFVGAAAERRFALPHARFRLEEPTAAEEPGRVADLERAAAAAADRRERVVALLAAATGQSDEQIAEDLAAQRTFEADEAATYGLIERVVQSRKEIQ
jgi:ATP-dependent Clp protease protease subunit